MVRSGVFILAVPLTPQRERRVSAAAGMASVAWVDRSPGARSSGTRGGRRVAGRVVELSWSIWQAVASEHLAPCLAAPTIAGATPLFYRRREIRHEVSYLAVDDSDGSIAETGRSAPR